MLISKNTIQEKNVIKIITLDLVRHDFYVPCHWSGTFMIFSQVTRNNFDMLIYILLEFSVHVPVPSPVQETLP